MFQLGYKEHAPDMGITVLSHGKKPLDMID